MKKLIILLFILLILPSVFASVDNYNNYGSLKLKFSESAELSLSKENGAKLDNLVVDLALVPKTDERQNVLKLDIFSNPTAQIKQEGDITYEWNEIYNKYDYGLNSEVEIKNIQYKTPYVKFPFFGLNEDIEKYTNAGDKIDINEDILNKANSLVSGESDEFSAVFNVAEWINQNVEYDLNTLTVDAVQKSSWVFVNKKGVCDEITNLFISMLRSVGIPARFVSGTVYSNINNDFGNHGWAEVYFPGYGWVPYDVTFGEYGYLDPSHLKLDDEFDSDEASVSYTWKSVGIDIEQKPLTTKTEVIQVGNEVESPFLISIKALQDKVGEGSYVPVEVTITNPYNYYLSDMLSITKAPKLTESNVKRVLLKPNQEKKIYWIVEVPKDLNPEYIYTSTLAVKDFYGKEVSTELEYSEVYNTFSLNEAEEIIQIKSEKEEKSYSKDLKLNCSLGKEYYYSYETAEIICDLTNIGNTALNNLNVCFKQDCKKIDLGISQKQNINFILNNENNSEIIVTAKNSDLEVNSYVNLRIYNEPDLRISNLANEIEKSYSESFDLEFILLSSVLIKDAGIKINGKKYNEIGSFKGTQKIIMPLQAKDFIGKAEIEIRVDYKDENNKEYSLDKKIKISINNVPWYAKFALFVKNLF